MVDTYAVIEGTIKFRDGKKWKPRWCVMRKLSPVADCLHLQLYRDSKDRYKQGQTKASLSLQHFLGVQSGFTLDKESNTIAIICQDVTVVLAFDTRERLIQWQVKIANNLGEDEQFLVQISSAPLRAKLSPGPALLHVLEYQFCLTVGVPPRLVGCWQINQLRRYGVVESRFCFEGGSRCGKGEGLYVLVTDQGDEITRTFRLAAEGKLSSKKRPASRNASDSPKKSSHGRAETRMSDVSCLDSLLQTQQVSGPPDESCCECSHNHEEILNWQLAGDFADASSVADFMDSHNKESNTWIGESAIERCASCISKLGALSRSSTAAMTPNSTFTPAWTMEANSTGTKTDANRVLEANALSSGANQNSVTSDSSSSKGSSSDCRSMKDSYPAASERCSCCPPVRPPKPGHLSSHSPMSSPKKQQKVPPDAAQSTSCSCNITVNPYDNYDVPKAPQGHSCSKDMNCHWNPMASEPEYYDTPKNIRDNLVNEYQNYDTLPPILIERKQMCTTLQKNQYLARVVIDNEDMHMVACPCQRIMCWAENWMFFPYCRRGTGRENTAAPPLHKKVSECGGEVTINNLSSVYATVDRSKKIKNRQPSDQECRYERLESHTSIEETHNKSDKDSLNLPGYDHSTNSGKEQKGHNVLKIDANSTEIGQNYSNFDFLQSLEFYENSKDMMQKTGKSHKVETFEKKDPKQLGTNVTHASESSGARICMKCRHECKLPPPQPSNKQDDYLMMEPSASENSLKTCEPPPVSLCGKHVPGYLPMHPIGGSSCLNHQDLLKLRMCHQMMHVTDRAASSPSLIENSAERCRRRAEAESHRTPGPTLLGFNHSVSAANSPYLRRRVLGCLHESTESDISSQMSRKRSCSSDTTNNMGEVDFMNKSTSSHKSQNETETIKNSSTDTIYSHKSSNKKSVDFDMTPITYFNSEPGRPEDDSTLVSELDEPSMSDDKRQYENIDWAKINFNEPIVHIRRSSSVPSKSSQNRDSSSSNDSGVSTSSLKKRKVDFSDGGIQDCSSGPSRRYTYTRGDKELMCECFHMSLPRRSKSVDPLRDLAFQFQKVEVPMKSSSAEAEVPICHPKRESRGSLSPGTAVPYIDSRSTSSGTSDMSDYFETLSLSSFSSSDTPDSLHFCHQAVSTMRPRSGKEYQKIDRNILESDLKKSQPQPSKGGKEMSATEKEG